METFSLIGGEEVVSLSRVKAYVFSDSVSCLGKMSENPQSRNAWEDRLTWFKSSPEYRALDKIDGEPMEFEWNIFPRFTTLQLVREVQELLSSLSVQPEHFTGRIIFVSMFNDMSWGSKEKYARMRIKRSTRFDFCNKTFTRKMVIPWTWIRKKWYYALECKPQGEWDRVAELMMLKFGESKHPVFRSTSPLSRGVLKSKGGGNLSIHFCADEGTIETVFRTIISVNQLSIYGALSDLCDEECKTFHVGTGRPVLV